MNNDFEVDSRFHCKVVLSDIYSEGLTGKSNLLKVNQDKTYSVLSQRSAEKLFLETLKRKDRIIWPPSSSVYEWTNLDHSVIKDQFKIRLIVLSLQCIIRLLISLALCLLLRNVLGVNRSVNVSINLVIKKNLLLKELESVGDPDKR